MIASSITDAAALVLALAALVIAGAVFVLVWRKGLKLLDARAAGFEVKLEAVQSQFKPNGGSSMRDVADRTEKALSEVRSDVRRIAEAGEALAARVTILEHPGGTA